MFNYRLVLIHNTSGRTLQVPGANTSYATAHSLKYREIFNAEILKLTCNTHTVKWIHTIGEYPMTNLFVFTIKKLKRTE